MIDVAEAMRQAGYADAAKNYEYRAANFYSPKQRERIESHWFRYGGKGVQW